MTGEPETREQQPGEWRTNPFLDPQVRNKILELENKYKVEVICNAETRKALEWIEEAHPEVIKQYKAIRDIEKAEYEAKHKFFGEIK